MIPTDAEYYLFSWQPDFMFLITSHGNAIMEKTQGFLSKRKKTLKADNQKETPIETGLKCR